MPLQPNKINLQKIIDSQSNVAPTTSYRYHVRYNSHEASKLNEYPINKIDSDKNADTPFITSNPRMDQAKKLYDLQAQQKKQMLQRLEDVNKQ